MYLPKRSHRYVFANSQRSKLTQKYLQDPQLSWSLAKRVILDLCDWIQQLEEHVDPEKLHELKNWANTDGYSANTGRSVSAGR